MNESLTDSGERDFTSEHGLRTVALDSVVELVAVLAVTMEEFHVIVRPWVDVRVLEETYVVKIHAPIDRFTGHRFTACPTIAHGPALEIESGDRVVQESFSKTRYIHACV